MESNYRIEGIYNLTLERNNSHARRLNFSEVDQVFFMLDYFNFLYVKRLKNDKDGYKMLCGIDNNNDMAAARKIMGIYTLTQSNEEVKDLFRCKTQEQGKTSEIPFLGIVQINIIEYECKSPENLRPDCMQDQLMKFRKKIEKSLAESLADTGQFQIYHTITSEDFCVVIRTADIRKIYEAVTGLMEVKNSQGKRLFFTYTNVGIECLKDNIRELTEKPENIAKDFLRLNNNVISINENIQFAIRFRMEKCVLEEIRHMEHSYAENCKFEEVNGIFGRYDLVARINVHEFENIYPYLCRNKAGYSIETTNISISSSPLVAEIVKGMENGTIKAINTRVLMDLPGTIKADESDAQPWFDKAIGEKIEKRSNKVSEQFKLLQNTYGNRFVFYRYRYANLCNMLERMISSYKNLAYELDTHTNWFICNQYLEIIFENIKYYMQGVQTDDDRAIEKFIDEFQNFVYAFGEFVRILQDNNQHTVQAPRYDVVTPIDGQKFLLAYGEYMDYMHEEYCNVEWQKSARDSVCREKRRNARVIIYPKVSGKNIEMMEVIQYDSVTKKQRKDETPSVLLCMIPMFEYFERTYDLIPLISHEICHHMLVLNRKNRNDFLIRMLFREISKIISYYIQAKACTGKYVTEYDSITELLGECLTKVFVKDYKETDGKNWEEYVSNHITQNVYGYMKKFLREEEGSERFGVGNIPWKNIVKRFHDIAKELYIEDENFETLLKAMDDCRGEQNGGEPVEFVVRDRAIKNVYKFLFNKINDLLPKEHYRITIEQLNAKNHLELDDFLVNWYEDYLEDSNPTPLEKQELKHYVDLVRRLQISYNDAVKQENCLDENHLEHILEAFAVNVEKKFRDEFLTGKKFCIYSPDRMERVTYWELLQPERAKRNYREILTEISLVQIKKAIDHTFTFYRESCADIIMCKWLKFNSFGYFRMAVTFSERMDGYREEIAESGLFRRRLIAVLSVLLKKEGVSYRNDTQDDIRAFPVETLWEQIGKYVNAEISHAKIHTLERIRKDYRNKAVNFKDIEIIHEKFFNTLEKQMNAAKNNVSEGKAIRWKGALWDDMFEEDSRFFGKIDKKDRDILCPLFQKEVNLYRRVFLILEAFGSIKENNELQVETEVLEHLEQVYDGMECQEVHPVVKEVVSFYNDPTSEKLTNFEKMKGMLRFVQDYYYYNRFKKMQEEQR